MEKLQVTKCQTATHIFFKRNEVSKEVKETFGKLEIPIPKSVLGISPSPQNLLLKHHCALAPAYASQT